IHKVGTDIENLDFNTAISDLMILVNEIYKESSASRELLEKLILILTPFAPHMCEEIWDIMGKEGFISLAPWPEVNKDFLVEDEVSIAVQVNGKKRGLINVGKNTTQDQALEMARQIVAVSQA